MTRFVGVLSGKGGVAKTTTVVNLGSAMNYFGRDVTIVDGNLSTPNLGLHLGVPVFPITLHDVLKGKNHLSEAIYLHPSGLKIVPSGLSIVDFRSVNPDNLSKVLPYLDGLSDIVLVDGSAGLGKECLAVMSAVDDIIVVTNPELPAVTDALKAIKLSEQLGKNVRGVVLAKSGEGEDMDIDAVNSMLGKKIIGIIPYDKSIRESLRRKEPVIYSNPKSRGAIAYKRLAANLMGIDYNEKADNRFGSFMRKVGILR